ncbi:hypothetical protein CTheo_6540 [Ceratobasidium theobromae]|uniref:Uncharacterized protein n=1 Tax=Ceratobasidium theobromae TaxID=1582974 RepID=A0A5N5QE43_9AGAM|nr:hypothetical protein CTheo_6540 [Ceratobasidium theobromae]
MDTSQFLLVPIGSLPRAQSPLAARFRDTFDLPPSWKNEFADNLFAPPPFCESAPLSTLSFPTEKSRHCRLFAPRKPHRRNMNRSESPPRLERIRTIDLEADHTVALCCSPTSRSPSPPPYGYCETFEEDGISAEEHAILAARSRAVHAERMAICHEQELVFRLRSLRASSSPCSQQCLSPTTAEENPLTEAEFRRARAEVRRRRRSERMRITELGNLLDAHRSVRHAQSPPPSYESSALGLNGGTLQLVTTAPATPQADQIVARMILKRREGATFRAPSLSLGVEPRRSLSCLRFEA